MVDYCRQPIRKTLLIHNYYNLSSHRHDKRHFYTVLLIPDAKLSNCPVNSTGVINKTNSFQLLLILLFQHFCIFVAVSRQVGSYVSGSVQLNPFQIYDNLFCCRKYEHQRTTTLLFSKSFPMQVDFFLNSILFLNTAY